MEKVSGYRKGDVICSFILTAMMTNRSGEAPAPINAAGWLKCCITDLLIRPSLSLAWRWSGFIDVM